MAGYPDDEDKMVEIVECKKMVFRELVEGANGG